MAAVDYFLKIDGIEGEAQDKTHKNEIQLQSWSWGETNTGSMGAGGGGSGEHFVDTQGVRGVGDAVDAQAAGIEGRRIAVAAVRLQDHARAPIVQENPEAAQKIHRDHAIRFGLAAESGSPEVVHHGTLDTQRAE